MTEQRQSSGLFSTNTQLTINYNNSSLSTNDVRAIATQIVQAEVEKYGFIGRDRFLQRTEEIREDILARIDLSSERNEKLQSFAEPYMHHALHEAQKAYGITGDNDLKEILVRIVDTFSSETKRTTRQIALHEAVEVARKVTIDQVKILTLVFIHNR